MRTGEKVVVNFDVVKDELPIGIFNLLVPYLDKIGEILNCGSEYATVRFKNGGEFWFREKELIAVYFKGASPL